MRLRGNSTGFRAAKVVRIFLRKCEPHPVLQAWDEWLSCHVGPVIGPNGERAVLGPLSTALFGLADRALITLDLDALTARTREAFDLSEREGQALRVLEEARAEEMWWTTERHATHPGRKRKRPDPHWRNLDGTPMPWEEQQKRCEAERAEHQEKFGKRRPCEFSHEKWKRLRRIQLSVWEISELEALLCPEGCQPGALYDRIQNAVRDEAPHRRQRKPRAPAAAKPTATPCVRCGKTDAPLEKFKTDWFCRECLRQEPSTKDERRIGRVI